MTTSPMSFLPAAVPDPRPTPEAAVSTLPTAAPPVTDDMVVVPRHVADTAYHVLKAAQALKDNAGNDVFRVLGNALSKHTTAEIKYAPPCEFCHVEVGQGFPHLVDCWSEEATRYRNAPVPLPILD